jgi:glucose-1-phosphate adenylyltransferase
MPDQRDIRQAPRRALALILAGGRGSRLKDLTDIRAKPAVYFGGKFRIIDFALSNCINSGFRRIGVLTQYKSHSLLRHLQRGWSFLRGEVNEFVELMPAQQRIDETSWYKGTADAVRQNVDILKARRPLYILILAGDHIYKMDYAAVLEEHIQKKADVTVACVEVPVQQASAFGVMHVDAEDRVVAFYEKPKEPPSIPGDPAHALASMGIYVFNATFLFDQLERDAEDPASSHDFGKDIIPSLVGKAKVFAHRFQRSCIYSDPTAEPYWRDVGTVDAYWEANIDLTRVKPALDLYDTNWPIFTYQEQLPPAKFVHDEKDRRGQAINSLVSGGCIVSGATVKDSLLFSKVRVNSYARIDESVILPEVNIGRYVKLRKVVIDRGCDIPPNLVVGEDPAEDSRRFYRSEGGVTLITKEMLARLGR